MNAGRLAGRWFAALLLAACMAGIVDAADSARVAELRAEVVRAAAGDDDLAHAAALLELALELTETQPLAAIDAFQQAIPIHESYDMPEAQVAVASDLCGLALAQRGAGRSVAAAASARRALALAREHERPDLETLATRLLANSLGDAGEFDEALKIARELLAEEVARADRAAQAQTLTVLGEVSRQSGRYEESLAWHTQALAIDRELGDRADELADLEHIGVALSGLGRYRQARVYFEQVLERARESGDERMQSQQWSSIAVGELGLGELDQAHESAGKALDLALRAGAPTQECHARDAVGDALQALGEYAGAIEAYRLALPVCNATLGARREAQIINDIGVVHLALGDRGRAAERFDSAQDLARQSGDASGLAAALSNRGIVHFELGEYDQALALQRQAAEIYLGVGDELALVGTLNNIGTIHYGNGDFESAIAVWQDAAQRATSLGGQRTLAQTLNNLGKANARLGRYEAAYNRYVDAMRLADEVGAPAGQASVRGNLREALVALGRPREAIYYGKQQVNLIQQMRQSSAALDKDLQRTLVGKLGDAYEKLADLLIEQGRLVEAQQVLGMLKEDEYFDYIRRDATADPRSTRVNYTPTEQMWQTKFEALNARAPQLDQEFVKWAQGLRAAMASSAAADVAALADGDVVARGFTQKDLASLGEGVVVVHFLVTDERIRILLTTPARRLSRESSVGRAELNRLVFEYRTQLQDPSLDPRRTGKTLYDALLGPIRADLQALGARTLMVYLDESLRYLPLAALYDGSRWLVEDYRLAIFAPLAVERLIAPASPDWQVAGLGTARRIDDFPALCAVPDELYGIVRTPAVPRSATAECGFRAGEEARGVLPGSVRIDEQFDRSALAAALATRVPVLHVASHFVFKPGTAADSFLLLGDGGHLTLDELRRAPELSFDGIELLTLSACETAVAEGRDADGAEVEGLGAIALRRGAGAVIATLWPVADTSTGLFMQGVYGSRERDRLSKAEALRQTQIAFIRGDVRQPAETGSPARGARREGMQPAPIAAAPPWPVDPAAPYGHPFFWAPFILVGNWL